MRIVRAIAFASFLAATMMPAQAVSRTPSAAIATSEPGTATSEPGTATSEPGTKFRECGDCPVMAVIPAGSFVMGSPEGEKGRFKNEGPEHRVTIARPFAMSVDLVTRADYARFVRDTRRSTPDSCRIYDVSFVDADLVRVRGKNWKRPNFTQGDDHPVVCLTWDDANAYIGWLNRKIGSDKGIGPYRLSTEAEWEYAARGGTTTAYYWGEEISRTQTNYGPDQLPFAPVAKGADRWKFTSPVGAFPANPFGLNDMAGNVWQFTQDCWLDSYEGAPSDGSARTDGKCDERAVRGGSWFKIPTGERSAKRGQGKVADLKGNHEIGFRVVRDLDR